MRCNMCGARISSNATRCEYCGAVISEEKNADYSYSNDTQRHENTYNNVTPKPETNYTANDDKPEKILNILAIFFPIPLLIVGIILKKTKPIKAKSIIKFAIIGIIIDVIMDLIFEPIINELAITIDEAINENPPDTNGGSGGGSTLSAMIYLAKSVLQML